MDMKKRKKMRMFLQKDTDSEAREPGKGRKSPLQSLLVAVMVTVRTRSHGLVVLGLRDVKGNVSSPNISHSSKLAGFENAVCKQPTLFKINSLFFTDEDLDDTF